MDQTDFLNSNPTSRRIFLKTTILVGTGSFILPSFSWGSSLVEGDKIKPFGPASVYQPRIAVSFVRRKEEYGMRWPGQIYDGEAALQMYKKQILDTAQKLDMKIDLRKDPIYSLEEADLWIAKAKSQKPDGLMLVTLDRQEHTWPTVDKAIQSNIPAIVFSPLGSSFTTNTTKPSQQQGVFICSTDDFNQAAYGIKMIKAGAKLRETKFLVLKGKERKEAQSVFFGTKFLYLPAEEFIKEYHKIPQNQRLKQLVTDLIQNATELHGPTEEDVQNGIKSYLVAQNLLEREKCDAITMDCLGALGKIKISLPCIAWSKMNDHGIPAACEADLGACITHALVQYLFDRPGFQQDPVAETSQDCIIGSHCSCPTRLNGFTYGSEPYEIVPHHGLRDATAKPVWKIGQRITVADVLLENEKNGMEMIISAGTVMENKSIPPSGGCVIAPMVKLDNVTQTLDYPGFHQIFFYGDFKKELCSYCKLYGIKPVVV
jgi:hypothetical protein